MARRGKGAYAGNDLGFAIDQFYVVAQRLQALPRDNANSRFGFLAHAHGPQIDAGGVPEIPLPLRHDVTRIGEGWPEGQRIAAVHGSPDVIGMGVGENHDAHVLRADAVHLQTSQYRP
jgi:hypothetical protein